MTGMDLYEAGFIILSENIQENAKMTEVNLHKAAFVISSENI